MKKLLLIPLLFSSINAFALTSLPNSESVSYEIKQMNVPVSGKFPHSKIDFNFDDAKLAQSKVSVTLPIKEMSVPSDEAKSIVHGKEWFNTTAFPNATFTSSKFEMKDKTHFIAEGSLNIKGVSKPVSLSVTEFNIKKHPFTGKTVYGAEANTTIKRSEFGINFGLPGLSDDVKITLNIEAN